MCADTNDSIITRGLRANRQTANNESCVLACLRIFSKKYTDPKKLAAIKPLKRKKVGRKKPKPKNDRGTVDKIQTGP